MKILVSYRGISQSPGWATGDSVVRAFRAMGHEVVPYGNYYQTSKRLEGDRRVLQEEWDLYLQMECGDGDIFYGELSNIVARKRATWWFDAALYPRRWVQETSFINPDVNFVANSTMLYENLRTEFLPYAADSHLHVVRNPVKTNFFGFIGSDRPERRRLAGKLQIPLISGMFRQDYIRHLSSCHYVINDIAGGGEGLIAMRPFETVAAGSTIITPKDDGVKSLGIPCIEYSSEDALVSICNLLKSENIIPDTSGQDAFLRDHTYEARCASMLKKLFKHEVMG